MAVPALKPRYTIEEYLAREREAVDRHEYHDGEIVRMPFEPIATDHLMPDVVSALTPVLRNTDYTVYDNAYAVAVNSRKGVNSPHATVVRGEASFDVNDRYKNTLLNPTLIVALSAAKRPVNEQESDSNKFDLYWSNPSLKEYVRVHLSQPRVETFTRNPGGGWLFDCFVRGTPTVTFRSLDVQLTLADIYPGIVFSD